MMATRVLMVELMTIKTKYYWEIAQAIIYLLIYFPFNKKQEHVLGYSFPSGIFGR